MGLAAAGITAVEQTAPAARPAVLESFVSGVKGDNDDGHDGTHQLVGVTARTRGEAGVGRQAIAGAARLACPSPPEPASADQHVLQWLWAATAGIVSRSQLSSHRSAARALGAARPQLPVRLA